MSSEDSKENSFDLGTSPSCKKPEEVIISASSEDAHLLNKINSHLQLCHAFIDQFRSEVSNYLPFLKWDVINDSALLKFCVRMKKCTIYFSSAMLMLEEQLEFCGLKLPQSYLEINALIEDFHQNHKRLTLFFQTVEHFFSPNYSPYLKETETSEFKKENPWENDVTNQYNLTQMCQIIRGSYFKYFFFRKRLEIFITIFVKLSLTFHCKQKYIMFPIIGAFKDIRCETIGLQKYLDAIGKSATSLKEMVQDNRKNKGKHQKIQKQYLSKKKSPQNDLKEETKQSKQVVHDKVEAQQSATKPLYSTIKQKAYGLMQTIFGSPSPLFKRQVVQRPQQAQRLLKEQ